MRWDVEEVESSRDECKGKRTTPKCGRAAIGAPSLLAIHKEAPDEEGSCEEEREGCVASVADDICHVDDFLGLVDANHLHRGREDGYRAY